MSEEINAFTLNFLQETQAVFDTSLTVLAESANNSSLLNNLSVINNDTTHSLLLNVEDILNEFFETILSVVSNFIYI